MADGRDEVNRAIDGFLPELADDGSAQATLKKYRLVPGKLRAYAADQDYTRLDAFTNLVVRDMRTGWNVSARMADKNMSTVKSLFDYAVTEGLIEFNPAARIKNRKNRATRELDARHEQKEPFSDAEIERSTRRAVPNTGRAQTSSSSRALAASRFPSSSTSAR